MNTNVQKITTINKFELMDTAELAMIEGGNAGKCFLGTVSGAGYGLLKGSTYGSVAVPGVGTVSGAIVGAVAGGAGGAAASCF